MADPDLPARRTAAYQFTYSPPVTSIVSPVTKSA